MRTSLLYIIKFKNKVLSYWFSYGIFGLGEYFSDKKIKWDSEKFLTINSKNTGSSISDNVSYVEFCNLAAEDENIFSRFRSSSQYRNILEHLSKRQGNKYLASFNGEKLTKKVLKIILLQSKIGSPITYDFHGIGKLAPSALRYLKVTYDIEKYFGNIDGLDVCEIGIGFGGQADLLISLYRIKSYSVYDLPEVNLLARKFLSERDIESKVNYFDGRNPRKIKSDLLISNYAFSELTRKVQEEYFDLIICNASRGYLTWNNISFKKYEGFSVKEILERIPGSKAIPENPLTWPQNRIIIWGFENSISSKSRIVGK